MSIILVLIYSILIYSWQGYVHISRPKRTWFVFIDKTEIWHLASPRHWIKLTRQYFKSTDLTKMKLLNYTSSMYLRSTVQWYNFDLSVQDSAYTCIYASLSIRGIEWKREILSWGILVISLRLSFIIKKPIVHCKLRRPRQIQQQKDTKIFGFYSPKPTI